jgi:hypothetical protein
METKRMTKQGPEEDLDRLIETLQMARSTGFSLSTGAPTVGLLREVFTDILILIRNRLEEDAILANSDNPSVLFFPEADSLGNQRSISVKNEQFFSGVKDWNPELEDIDQMLSWANSFGEEILSLRNLQNIEVEIPMKPGMTRILGKEPMEIGPRELLKPQRPSAKGILVPRFRNVPALQYLTELEENNLRLIASLKARNRANEKLRKKVKIQARELIVIKLSSLPVYPMTSDNIPDFMSGESCSVLRRETTHER